MVDVALAREGGALGVGEVLVKVIAEVAAPDDVAGEVAVGERDDVDGLVGEEGERGAEHLVALAAGDGALDQALAKEFEDAVVRSTGKGSPGVDAEQGFGRGLRAEIVGAEIADGETGGRGRKRRRHELRQTVRARRRRAMPNETGAGGGSGRRARPWSLVEFRRTQDRKSVMW